MGLDMAQKPTDEYHCTGCGHDTREESGDRVVRVEIGRFLKKDASWKPRKVWGNMHLRCFLIAIGDPEGVQVMANSVAAAR